MNKDTFGMVAYSVTLGDDDTFTIRDFGVYNLYHRAASMHIINTERLAQQMESKSQYKLLYDWRESCFLIGPICLFNLKTGLHWHTS